MMRAGTIFRSRTTRVTHLLLEDPVYMWRMLGAGAEQLAEFFSVRTLCDDGCVREWMTCFDRVDVVCE